MVPWKLLFIYCYGIQLVFAQSMVYAIGCITPHGVRSQCKPIMECGRLINFLRSRTSQSILPEERQYIDGINCHRDRAGNQRVCCAENDIFYHQGTTTTTTRTTLMQIHLPTPPLTNLKPRPPSRRPLPSKSKLPKASKHECGNVIITNRILGGNDTIPGEFAWMALLEYQIPTTKERSFACSGSLIHRRFVITAAHCVVGRILQVKGALVNIRLGEHDLSTVRDCEYTDGACADPVIDVGISLIVPHPNYTDTSRPRAVFNDIALVRLVRNIESTYYINPICFSLPNMHSPTGQYLTVSGWGRTKRGTSSDVKLKVSVPVVDFRSCQQTLRQIVLNEQTQICAGGVAQQDSCRGDSGGPLMVSHGGVWYLEGLVSFGANECGLPGIPGIYTRVNSYIDWVVKIVGMSNRADTIFEYSIEEAEG